MNSLRHNFAFFLSAWCAWLALSVTGAAQTSQRNYPTELRGYKVAQARVIIQPSANPALNDPVPSQPSDSNNDKRSPARRTTEQATDDAMVTLGAVRVARITPLGVTLEVPLTIAPLKQGGKVDFIAFEDIKVNEGSVELPDYQHPFKLPSDKPLTLTEPLRVFISAPSAISVLADDWWGQKAEWRVTGRAYIFGSFKKFLFNFKRVVPVEFDLMVANPLHKTTNN